MCLFILSNTIKAQKSSTEIERLTKDMYRLYSRVDSLDRFMQVTDKLKEECKKAGNDNLFWRTWSNQATFISRTGQRERGLGIAKEMTEYAKKHDTKYGLYISSSTNAKLVSGMKMESQAEELYKEAISYKERYLPNVNIAADYLGLAKIYHNRNEKEKVLEMTDKALKEPKIVPAQRLAAWCLKCIVVINKNKDYQQFNKYYAELEKVRKETGLKSDLSIWADIFNAEQYKDYDKMMELAKSIKSPMDRMQMIKYTYRQQGKWREAYEVQEIAHNYADSVNSDAARNMAAQHSLAIDAARAENEAKDLKLKNQKLEMEQIAIELRNRDIELQNAAVKFKNDSLESFNKDLKYSELASRIEIQKQNEETQRMFIIMLAIIALLIISSLGFILYRRNKHSKEIENAYGKLEEAYGKLEETTTAKERIESELRIARDIQMEMVPHVFNQFPAEYNIDLFASMTPAKEVGGDLYDFSLQGKFLYVCLGDVSGKGVPASMTMAVAVNLFRSIAKGGYSPEYITTRLNDTLSADNESKMFVTMFIAKIDLETGHMDFCNAGHNPPVIINNSLKPGDPNRTSYLKMETNIPIGLWEEMEFVGESVENLKGKTLLIYTDGVTEAENEKLEQYGDDRLLELLRDSEQTSSESILNLIKNDLAKHVGNAAQSDDLTMLCLKI